MAAPSRSHTRRTKSNHFRPSAVSLMSNVKGGQSRKMTWKLFDTQYH